MGDESCSEGSNPSFSAEHFLMTEWLNVDMVLKSESGSPLPILKDSWIRILFKDVLNLISVLHKLLPQCSVDYFVSVNDITLIHNYL